MASIDYVCKVPVIIIGLIGGVANIIMVIGIYKSKLISRPNYFIFTCIGILNAFFALFDPVAFMFEVTFQGIRKGIAIPLSMVLLGMHFTLTYARWMAVFKPLQYRQNNNLRYFIKRIIIMAIVSLAFGLVLALPTGMKVENRVRLTLGIRFIITVVFAVIYQKIYKQFKKNKVTTGIAEQDENSAASQIRKRNEKNLLIMSFWISGSFIVSGLPATICRAIFPTNHPCSTAEGTILVIAYTTFLLNYACDPITFYFMERRRKACIVKANSISLATIE